MPADWMWCYENPKDAAAEIDALRQRVAELEATLAERENFVLRMAHAEAERDRLRAELEQRDNERPKGILYSRTSARPDGYTAQPTDRRTHTRRKGGAAPEGKAIRARAMGDRRK